MLSFLILAGLVVAAPAPQTDGLTKIELSPRRSFARSTGEVNGPALLRSLQQTLNKYRSKLTIPGASANASLRRRLATENLLDQVETPDFDVQYYGSMEVGDSRTEQIFTVQFDTGITLPFDTMINSNLVRIRRRLYPGTPMHLQRRLSLHHEVR